MARHKTDSFARAVTPTPNARGGFELLTADLNSDVAVIVVIAPG